MMRARQRRLRLHLSNRSYQWLKKPNILFFHVDNLGMGELGCYGGGILRGADTRRMDSFAKRRRRSSPTTSSSRSARRRARR